MSAPYGLISRAEATTIFFRLLKDSVRDGNLLTSNTYTDVADNYWANTAISTMTGLGIVQGRTATPATGSIWPCRRLPTPMITSTKPVITRLGAA